MDASDIKAWLVVAWALHERGVARPGRFLPQEVVQPSYQDTTFMSFSGAPSSSLFPLLLYDGLGSIIDAHRCGQPTGRA